MSAKYCGALQIRLLHHMQAIQYLSMMQTIVANNSILIVNSVCAKEAKISDISKVL